MKIVDKTPYRSANGQIEPMGRIQGTLKYGLSWYNRVMAQDVVISIIEKQLDSNYALLRNVTLPNTEINLPLVLVGPPGVYMINVTPERGVHIARDDQWGTMVGARFVPARINQISRTMTFTRVLQLYLDRQGFKGSVVVEGVLMASDPGMQIESTRPAVRVVMSDALERFAASLGQARPALSAPLANDIVQAILVGRPQKIVAPELEQAAPVEEQEDTSVSSFGGFSFEDQDEENEGAKQPDWSRNLAGDSQPAQKPQQAKKTAPKKKNPLGLTTTQLVIVGALALCSLCTIAAAIYIVLTNV